MFIRKKYRGKDLGFYMLEDFVDFFIEDVFGLRYLLFFFMYIGEWIELENVKFGVI